MMKVKCPRCDYKGEVVDGKCSVCDLPIESTASKIPKNIYEIAALILVVIIVVFASIYVKNHFLKGDLDGEVFIVTNGGQNIRLALVEVRIITDKTLSEVKKMKTEEFERERQRLAGELENAKKKIDEESDSFNKELTAIPILARFEPQVNYLKSAKFFLDGIPEGIIKTKTDVDGKFNLKIKRGESFWLFAHGTRIFFDKKEDYYWLVPINLKGNSTMKISLNNDNLFDNLWKMNN